MSRLSRLWGVLTNNEPLVTIICDDAVVDNDGETITITLPTKHFKHRELVTTKPANFETSKGDFLGIGKFYTAPNGGFIVQEFTSTKD